MNTTKSTNDIVFKKLFDLIDDEQTRINNKILYSKHTIENIDNHVEITWTIWCANEYDEIYFKEISAVERVSKEIWKISVDRDTFVEITTTISSNDNSDLNLFWDKIEISETEAFFIDMAELPDAVITAYNEYYISDEIGAELCEWFGDETIDFNTFPQQIHDMLIRSLRLHWHNEGQEYATRKNFALYCESLNTFLIPGANDISKLPPLKSGLAIVCEKRRGMGSSDYLKRRKFMLDIDALKAAGHQVISFCGIFSGENADDLCIGITNISESEAKGLIKRTETSVGLHVNSEGVCKILESTTI